mgnify:CR=1 FL=1
MPKRSVSILLVENEPSLAEMIEECLLEVMQVQINRVSCAGEALREELNHRHDLVITELSLHDADGLELVRRIQVSNKCPIILLADSPTPEDLIDAMRLGIRGVAHTPSTPSISYEPSEGCSAPNSDNDANEHATADSDSSPGVSFANAATSANEST